MENNEPVVENQNPIVSAFSDVEMIDPEKSIDTKPAEQAPVVAPEVEALTKERDEWKEKATTLEAREPQKEVVYQLPEDYVSIMENPENRRLLDTDPNSLPDVVLYKQILQRGKALAYHRFGIEQRNTKTISRCGF